MSEKKTRFVQSFLMTANRQISFTISDEEGNTMSYQFVDRPRGFWVSVVLMCFVAVTALISPPSFPWAAVPYTFINLGVSLFSMYLILKTPTKENLLNHPLTNVDVSDQDIGHLHRTVQWQQSQQLFHKIKNLLKIVNAAVFAGIGGYILTHMPVDLPGWESLVNYFPLNAAIQAFLFQVYLHMLVEVVIPVYLNNRCAYLSAKVHRLCNPIPKGE